jgi:hypothetical protein
MEYYVSPCGDDDNPGTEQYPYRTITRGLHGASPSPTSKLEPGDILTLFGGTYLEAVKVAHLAGTEGNEITIRSFPGERAVIDSGIAAFRVVGGDAWIPAVMVDPAAHPDEWASCQTFSQEVKPTRGAFLKQPYRRLVTYSTNQDFRSYNQTSDKIFYIEPFDPNRGPYKVTNDKFVPLRDPPDDPDGREFTFPWVYMGPGLRLFHDEKTHKNRIHVRLSHTNLNIPGLEDYQGPTDPNEVALAINNVNDTTMTIVDSRSLIFSNLTIRFGGRVTILVNNCQSLTFDGVDVFASTGGIRFGALTGAMFQNCRFDGGLPPWFYRTDKKAEYYCLLTPNGEHFHNERGKETVDVLMFGEGSNKQDFEIHHCEFVNGHDLYLVAKDTCFHHNWIDNLNDEGMVLDTLPSASGQIHSNVITRCLSAISMAGIFTAGQWHIYRNLIDLRVPTAGNRPSKDGNTPVFRFGNVFKSNEQSNPDGPYDIFHNTFLVAEQKGDAAYLHYSSALSPHRRRSFNNIFVAVNPNTKSDIPITFVPPPSFPGPTDGNLYHRYGAHTVKAFISVKYTFNNIPVPRTKYTNLDELRSNEVTNLFDDSKTQYAPGYEAHSLLTDPVFQKIDADGSFHPLDDLRLSEQSPARNAAVELPPDLQALDDDVGTSDDAVAISIPVLRAIGCYRFGSEPLQVGVHGQRRFPIIGTVP